MELSIFDFDDTLFITDSMVRIKKKSGKTKLLNSSQFAKYKPKDGDEFDFSDFDRITGSFVEWTKERFDLSLENERSKTVIITARSKTDNIKKLLQSKGYNSNDILIIGTGSGDPHSKIDEVKSLINKFDPDLIIGSRINYDEYSRSHNFYNKLGNMLITTLFNMRYNTTFTDIYSCYICFKRNIIDPDKLTSNGFQQQAELLRKIIKKSRNHYEIKISYNGRNIEDGKKIRWHHIFSVIFEIFKFW